MQLLNSPGLLRAKRMGAKEGSKQKRDKCESMTRYKRAERANSKVDSEKVEGRKWKEAAMGMSKWEMSEGKEKSD